MLDQDAWTRVLIVPAPARAPEAVADTAWRLAADLTCDDALGIHLAESLPRGALDLLEYAYDPARLLRKGSIV